MNKLRAISVADLLILRNELGPQGLGAETAALLGFARESRPLEDAAVTAPTPVANSGSAAALEDDDWEFPPERSPFPFLLPVAATTLQVEQPAPLVGSPITLEELKADKRQSGLALRPLIRWSKLARHLKNRLGALRGGTRLDTREMLRLAGAGRPLTKLPRLQRRVWAAQVAILWDHTPEMYPFAPDAAWLCRSLKRERGKSGFRVIELKGVPRARDLAWIPPGTPILALSAMGQLTANEVVQQAWLRFAQRLKLRGDQGHVLNPCPRARWDARLAAAWSVTLWDRGPRLPRRGGMTAIPPSASRDDLMEALLTWLAPASLIEIELLREVRLRLERAADAGTEWDAWQHVECRRGVRTFGLLPGAAYDERLKQRRELACAKPQLAAEIQEAIRQHHQTCSQVIAAEAALRLCLSGLPDALTLERVKQVFGRVIDRLRELARHPHSDEGVEFGLAHWFPAMVQRLSPDMRGDESVREFIAQGLALCRTWLETAGEVPLGVDRPTYNAEERAASARVAGTPVDYLIGLKGSHLSFVPAGTETQGLKPLGRLLVGGTRRVQVDVIGAPSPPSLPLDGGTLPSLPLSDLSAPFQLRSSHGTLTFEVIERPAWAERFWYDHFGIAAEFSIRDVPFVLRWIPPGQFQMGSPDSEVGRYVTEGPQHAVTISRGFWLGETPVTQGQWEAMVAEQVQKRFFNRTLNPKPSRFRGEARLPVEQVTWQQSATFCNLLNDLVDNWDMERYRFQLPTEAQWEYACRAGTSSAFYDGSACTIPEGIEPALDDLGWFIMNSQQMTHTVKEMQPNPWGLYDLHGNVWEWCADAWDAEAYQSRSAGIVDPFTDGKDSAHRVVRGGSSGAQARGCRAACRDFGRSGSMWEKFRGLRVSAGHEHVFRGERRVP